MWKREARRRKQGSEDTYDRERDREKQTPRDSETKKGWGILFIRHTPGGGSK